MINRFLFIVVVLGVFAFVAPVSAQNCGVNYEAIVNLRDPAVGTFNVWDTIHGAVETHERFSDAIVLKSGNILVVGERSPKGDFKDKKLIFSEIGRNGRVLWEKEQAITGYSDIIKFIPHKDGALLLLNITPAKGKPYAWAGVYNVKGERLRRTRIKDPKGRSIAAHDIVSTADQKGYVLAATYDGTPSASVLYRLNSAAGIVSERTFNVGADNAVNALHVFETGDILAVGHIHNAIGRKTGWVMRLTKDMQLIWQKPFSRGDAAELVAVDAIGDNGAMIVGTSLPIGTGNRATWVMAMDAVGGDIIWQRYYAGALHFDGRDVLVNDDDITSVLMDGKTPDDANIPEHVRLLTINPRGVLFDSDEYFNGEGVDATRLLIGPARERLVVGTTLVDHRIGEAQDGDDAKIERSHEGWVLAATPVDPYTDPCVPVQRNLP